MNIVNSDTQLHYCLRKHAYLARKLKDPMEQVTSGIMAQCSMELSTLMAAEYPFRSIEPRSQRAYREVGREEDLKDETKDALAMVLDYRTCALGVPSDTVESFSNPPG